MEAFGRMVAIILAVILLMLFPIRYEAQKTDISVNSYVDTEMNRFFHIMSIRQEITRQMFAEFCDQISATGISYCIEIERYSNVIYQEEFERQYLDYEDICFELKSSDHIPLNNDDYIIIRIQKQGTTVIDRLKNLFLPTSAWQSVYMVGGSIK